MQVSVSQPPTNLDPWTEVSTPNGVYYWNKITGETTAVGEAKPLGMHRTAPAGQSVIPAPPASPVALWTEVRDPATGAVYYWNQSTGETTAVGEPRPTGAYRVPAPPQFSAGKVGAELGSLVLWGAGVTFGFAIVGAAARMIFG